MPRITCFIRYFTEGVFVALDGPTYDDSYKARVYKRFPEWSPQRHMFMDAPQRQAVRGLRVLACECPPRRHSASECLPARARALRLHASAHYGVIAPLSSQVRDLLGLSRAIEGSITVLPKLWCHCDRYWNFLTRCRMPMLQHMELPFGCPMDSLCVLMVTDEP